MSDEMMASPPGAGEGNEWPTRRSQGHPGRQGSRTDGRHDGRHGPVRRASGPERCVALVDARFWWWLQDAEPEGSNTLPDDLFETLQATVRSGGNGVNLSRVVWFTDAGAAPRHAAGVGVRQVPSNSQDGGVAMLRGMAQELALLSSRAGADRVLLVSDDERLLLAIDDAQRSGLAVDMLIDEDARDERQLREDEPQWARLLMLADRQLVLGDGAAARQAHSRERAGPRDAKLGRDPSDARPMRDPRQPASPEALQLIEDELSGWWGEETPVAREHWRHEIQSIRGIPQELDRQLLLRISRRTGQPLSPAEKNEMRALARRRIQGEASTAEAAAAE